MQAVTKVKSNKMTKITEIEAKNIIIKSNLPDADYVINPYTGCTHSCIYCYARFMKRFTGHSENWGSFIDVKINGVDLVPIMSKKYENKSIFMSSVTDPYLPLEKKYKITRNILLKLVDLNPAISIQTKSSLVTRDIDVFKQFADCQIGMTITTLDDHIRKQIEPKASSIEKRISALIELKNEGLSNYVFIGPILPCITNWREIIDTTKDFVDSFMFENLNVHGTIAMDVDNWVRRHHVDHLGTYSSIRQNKSEYWGKIEKEIIEYCTINNINFKMYFDHKKQRKRKN